MIKLQRSLDHQRAIILRTPGLDNQEPPPRRRKRLSEPLIRTEAVFGTKSYDDGLQRAFNRVKQQVFFNPDMTLFVTMTYAENQQNIDVVLSDFKKFIRLQKKQSKKTLKYIFILEKQKRGALHIHAIMNDAFITSKNKNGYQQLDCWPHGFTSVLTIKDVDNSFKSYLYLFKYMRKAQRIGKSFVHSSRNLNNFVEIPYETFDESLYILAHKETTEYSYDETVYRNYRYYLDSCLGDIHLALDIMRTPIIMDSVVGGTPPNDSQQHFL